MKRFLLAALLSPSLALAQQTGTVVPVTTGVSACALDGDCTTDWMEVTGYAALRLTFAYTYDSATAFTLACVESDDKTAATTGNLYPIKNNGETTTDPIYQWLAADWPAATVKWTWIVGVAGLRYVKCTPTAADAVTADVVTITGRKWAP